ncbi:Conserved oligomeric Golgi complex subunit 8 [Trichuris trichiura]|uniref:Conserved oligomeric Golgi complex subunit 8 n=1 Tax=Trichuris trichiura TaxID=36087 RepID=A0A077Z4K1_TRITR|nr:Conserved oligomeric Golgi complex subunit 8 [Trichuris trichiura]
MEKERANVLSNIRELAFSNYGTFIRTIRCSEEVKERYTGLHDDIEKLMKELRTVQDEGSQFLKTFQVMSVERSNLTAAKHSSEDVKKLFELSSLIEKCVRKGHYEEAFELIQLASRLGRCLGNIAIVFEVTEHVKNQRNYLLSSCLQQLRAPLTLTQCLKLVGFLRRMDVYSEAELQFQFLLCRDSWLQSQLDKRSFSDEYQRLNHIVEVYQEAMFDVMLQYRAVFSEESSHSSSGSQRDALQFHCPSVVASWLHYRLQCFTETLSNCLLHCPVDRLDSIMMHCMYFGASMGRVGTDARHLLVCIFEDHILKLMEQSLGTVTAKLLDSLKSTEAFRIAEVSSAVSDVDPYLDVKSGPSIKAPIALLSYPPLAIYCNRIIEIFDKLHSCVPVSLALFTAELLDSSLSLMVDSLKTSFERSSDPDGVIAFATLVEESLVPFLDKCLDVLFPANNLSVSLGISLATLIQKVSWGKIVKNVCSAYFLGPSSPLKNYKAQRMVTKCSKREECPFKQVTTQLIH